MASDDLEAIATTLILEWRAFARKLERMAERDPEEGYDHAADAWRQAAAELEEEMDLAAGDGEDDDDDDDDDDEGDE